MYVDCVTYIYINTGSFYNFLVTFFMRFEENLKKADEANKTTIAPFSI